jgi:hypothetical protein
VKSRGPGHGAARMVAMTPTDELSIVAGEPIAMQPGRTLTAWMPEDEAIATLLGRNREPDDDLTALSARIERARASLAARAPFVATDPLVLHDRTRLDELAQRDDIKASFAGMHWTVEMVDMALVQSLQVAIKVDGLDERIGPVVADPAELWELCIPTERKDPPRGAFKDADQRGYTLSSLNPNLRVAGSKVDTMEVVTAAGPIKVQAVMFFVSFGHSYMHVAHHGGRYFLRDGYHRVVGLMAAGITKMPCLVVNMQGSFEEIMPGRQSFPRDVCFSDRPPLVSDFLDDAVADDFRRPVSRKVIRIRTEEFAVQG